MLWNACDLVVPWNDPHRDLDRKLAVAPEGLRVALRGDEIVGTVMVGYEGHRGWINYLAVAPEHRRGGVGRRLMDDAQAWLRQRGCPKINLQVRHGNDAALRFYEAVGFKVDACVSLGMRLEDDTTEQAMGRRDG